MRGSLTDRDPVPSACRKPTVRGSQAASPCRKPTLRGSLAAFFDHPGGRVPALRGSLTDLDLISPDWPLALSNWLSTSDGSIFVMIPWFGYMAFGAFIATLFYRYVDLPRFKLSIIFGFIITGLILIYNSSLILLNLGNWLDLQVLIDASNYNYLFRIR